jgi:glycosyltransferase involved in cell wall biosynthesis
MKVLILSDDFPPKSFGGAGIIAYTQAKELAKRGHEVSVITTTQNKVEAGQKNFDGLTIYNLYADYNPKLRAYRSINNPEVVGSVENILSSVKPDIVHAHNIHQFISYKSLTFAKKHAKKVFLTAHDAMLVHYSKVYPRLNYKISNWEQFRYFWRGWNPFRNLLIHRYLRNVDKIISVSGALAVILRQNGISNVEVLHNGIDAGEFIVSDIKVREFKDKFGLNGKNVMFFGGRLGRAKGGNIAVELLKEINKTLPEVVLLVAGAKDESMEEENVIFTGWLDRSQMTVAYGASDVVLTLSIYMDPFPTVNLEAMAAGKPVIGTCFGGTPEIVLDGITGFVVNPLNQGETLEKTLKILNDTSLANRLGQAGCERARTLFNLRGTIDKLERIYKEY